MSAELPTVDNVRDPRVWLESVLGTKALDYVRSNNQDTLAYLGEPKKMPLFDKIRKIMDSKEKIAYVGRSLDHGAGLMYYNFWQDAENQQGLWRRCTPEEYRKDAPQWETVLSLDELSKAEGVTWVWAGSGVLDEGPEKFTEKCFIKLSVAGADATHVREFDIVKKRFVPESEGGFVLPEGKTNVGWKDRDTLYVGGSLLGEGSVTTSGYARTSREWKRGTPLTDAVEVYAGQESDVQVLASSGLDRGFRYSYYVRAPSFFETEYQVKLGPEGFGATNAAKGFRKVPVPASANVDTHGSQVIITLRNEWLGYPAGAMLAAPSVEFLEAADDAAIKKLITVLFEPTEKCSLDDTGECKSYLILHLLNNVRSELRFWQYSEASKTWSLKHTIRGEGVASISMDGLTHSRTDDLFATSSSFTLPTTLSFCHADTPKVQTRLKSLPAFFETADLEEQQFEATSLDGTTVPYFLVSKKGMKLDGTTPTLLYGYGGFEISLTPGYQASTGVAWLEKGYAYVQANIRGGGEFGPTWHQAALKEKRHKAYEDFEAVAKDLVKRGVTCRERLGVEGGSNGGLLTGNMLARSPELFGAIVSAVPLLDMKHYNRLLAGASWMSEYGDPDVADEWEFLRHNSPYHTLAKGKAATPTLFTTSTRDDRVHPAHARKLAAKMYDLGLPVLSYENIEGGHGGAANNEQRAFMSTLMYAFLYKTLVDRTLEPELAKRPPRDGGRRVVANWVYLAGEMAGDVMQRAPPIKWMVPTVAALALAAVVVMRPRLR